MTFPTPHPLTLGHADGLQAELLSHGALRRLLAHGLTVNLFPGNELEGGPANLWLRRTGADGRVEFAPLLGPNSPLTPDFDRAGPDGVALHGRWQGLALTLRLRLVPGRATAFWQLAARNEGAVACTLNLLLLQDVGLAAYDAIRLNEYYVSQYLDLQPLAHPRHGTVLAVRQNQAVGGRHPWLLAGALRHGARWATDALQVWGHDAHAGAPAAALRDGLPATRLQHEHAMVALEDEALPLQPGQTGRSGFVLHVDADHPAASGDADLARFDALLALPEARGDDTPGAGVDAGPATPSLFATAPMLPARALDATALAAAFPGPHRHAEAGADGTPWSFFHGEAGHVVLQAKELAVQRPHGHLLRAGAHLVPDERALTSTCWMGGVFHSMLTQGHVSFNRLLSTQRSWLGLFRSHGLRVFVERAGGGWALLGLPSAFEMRPEGCRWLYAHEDGLIEVRSEAGDEADRVALQLRVLEGDALRWRITLHVALGGDDGAAPGAVAWQRDGSALRLVPPAGSALAERFPHGAFVLEPSAEVDAGDDGRLYPDGRSRGEPLLCLDVAPARAFSLAIRGGLIVDASPAATPLPLPAWQAPAGADGARVAQLADVLPWFRHNALVHYLSPRGLEQYSGGGWGTRDVCQGPLEMLLALGHTAPVRDLLVRVFSAQNTDGDWPQWFMFFERDAAVRAGDSHGDIVFWPLLALAQYLEASGDAALLAQPLPFHGGAAEPLQAHVERSLALIRRRCLPGSPLAAYGHGDWNDSLQPADPALRERLCSAWTVTLHHQTLTRLAQALHGLGRGGEAATLQREAEAVRAAFRARLMPDGVVAGYLYLGDAGRDEHWLHPADPLDGPRYSLLPMMHAVLENLLAPDEAARQAALIDEHLKGPDGARLFDAPPPYRGGPTQRFQRAETSSFFGREIGVMYMHAHLRWAQMLAHLGRAAELLDALALAHPIGLPQRVASANPRQANCYYSSSDAAFSDRYEAQAHYADALTGRVPLEGGWRIYSSGPGIAIGLVIGHLLGLRLAHDRLVVDPVMPASLDGLRVQVPLGGFELDITYRVGPQGHGVQAVRQAGQALPFQRQAHPYRTGGAELPRPAAGTRLAWEIVVG